MGTFDFNVISGDGGRVPISVAGSVMVSIQRLLFDLGEHSVAKSMSLQGSVPKGLLSRFELYVDGGPSSIASSSDLKFERSGDMLKETLEELVSVLSGAGGDACADILSEYPDPGYRMRIAKGLTALSEGLGGMELRYSDGRTEGMFSGMSEAFAGKLSECSGGHLWEVRGVMRGSGSSTYLETEDAYIPMTYDGELADYPHDLLNSPCMITGKVSFLKDGKMEKINGISKAEKLAQISFERVISSETSLVLKKPLIADAGYDDGSKEWTLSNESLGISLSKEHLDDAILEFHDQFVFMWEVYDEGSNDSADEDFDADELKLHDYILSIVEDGE